MKEGAQGRIRTISTNECVPVQFQLLEFVVITGIANMRFSAPCQREWSWYIDCGGLRILGYRSEIDIASSFAIITGDTVRFTLSGEPHALSARDFCIVPQCILRHDARSTITCLIALPDDDEEFS